MVGLPEVILGVMVSILRVVCVTVVGWVAVVVTVTVVVPLSLPGSEVVMSPLLPVLVVDVSPLPPGLRLVDCVEFVSPAGVVVGLNTPVVAAKDVFVPFELSG